MNEKIQRNEPANGKNCEAKDGAPLYIIGAGGNAREMAETVAAINRQAAGPRYHLRGYFDDDPAKRGTDLNGVPVLGDTDDFLKKYAEEKPAAIISIADTKIRRRLISRLEGAVCWPTLIHPQAIVSEYAEIGCGCIIQPFAWVGPNARLGDHVQLNISAAIGHDAHLANYVSVMIHVSVSGAVHLEEGVFIASGATLVPGIRVGENATIGAGAVVTRDIPGDVTAFGNPCRVIRAAFQP